MKGGEDLRNDQRIQQLFELFNSCMAESGTNATHIDNDHKNNDSNTNRHDNCLQARTYMVMPMTTRVGLLQWVSDTKPLRIIFAEEMFKNKGFRQANPDAVSTVCMIIILIFTSNYAPIFSQLS